ncbi:ABC transporter substrate-binding protein [Permianibacter sp. IMCC34836]|uniref:Tgt2/MlaC family protein n=1 Tax=Permianibacter fluminis TaxID=2738515 RepID=UPI001552DAB8|nr:ABC transporter substrate-binding protein [Permianibacter fluminis]NQD37401.1 ABC transporter substrate-binding protein [Permianibacter fluminis]
MRSALLSGVGLAWLSLSPVAADSVMPVEQASTAALQQSVQHAFDEFMARLAAGSRGAVLLPPADAIVRQWLANTALARRLAGADNWRTLTPEQQQQLASEVTRTLVRYLLEASAQYSGQQLNLETIDAPSANRRLLHLTLRGVSGFDAIPVVIELIQQKAEWRVADFSVEGVTYTGMKRWQYDVLWRTGGYEAFLNHLKTKNDLFFAEIQPVTATATAATTGSAQDRGVDLRVSPDGKNE